MVKVIHLDDDGAETAVIELDDFTIETVYQGIAVMLRDATPAAQPPASASSGLSKAERLRRQRILTRLHA